MNPNITARLNAALAEQRQAHAAEPMPTLARRLDRLARLSTMTQQHEAALIAAISADFGHRSAHETLMAELLMIGSALRQARQQLKSWMKTRRVGTPLHYLPGRNVLMRQPLGVVGVVAPWNYPYQLALGPAIGAIAAGNRVMIKPSELTPRFSELLQSMVQASFATDEIMVVPGDAEVARAFVALPFDHLVFTGSTAVGRQVALAAAANLTPVTLELGGKSPAILDTSADVTVAAPRIAFGKWLNAGQTCIAPDYLLVPKGMTPALVTALQKAVSRMYPEVGGNPDYSNIINDHHRSRLQSLLDDAVQQGATVVPLTAHNARPNERKLVPAVLLNVRPEMRLMQEEIFGPMLPIVEYTQLDEAIAHVNAGERPLALYWFGNDMRHRDRVLAETVAGGVTINDCLWHFSQEAQPFGGVGASGQGAYHGEWGFRRFSHEKPVFLQARHNGVGLLHPPYGKTFARLLALLKRVA